MVEIRLLGRFVVSVDGAPLSGDAAQKRRLAILPLLAGPEYRPIARERVIGVLWPDHDPDAARHLLSAGLHVLRRALGADAILSRGDELAFNPERVNVDVVAFRRALAAHDHEAALQLYEGPFLEGFHVTGAVDFEQWVDEQRAELARLAGIALEQAAEVRAARGDDQGALDAWRRRASLDPYDGRTALALMRAMVAAGERTAALRHAQVHGALLEQELGAAPDPEVVAYAESIRSAPAPDAPAAAPATRSTSPEPAPAARGNAAEGGAPPAAAGDAAIGTGTRPAARPVHDAAAHSSARRPTRWSRIMAPAALVLLLLITGAVWLRLRPVPEGDLASIRRIAVIPFRADSASAHWGQGLADVMIYELRRIEGLDVLSRDVSFAYAGRDPRSAVRELDVDALFGGNLAVTPEGIWVGVELVNAQGRALFSDDFFHARAASVQHGIASAVATRLRRSLRPEAADVQRREEVSHEAYEAYLLGRFAWFARTPGALDTALLHFRHAVELDSTYALAYVGVADALNMLASYDYGALPPDSAYPLAEQAAERALQLDPQLAAAHAARANVAANYWWEWEEAEAGYRRALQLEPQFTSAHQWLSLLLASQRRFDEAVFHARRANEAEPGAAIAAVNRAHIFYYRREYDAARALLDHTLRNHPSFNRAHVLHALIDLAEGKAPAARARFEAIYAAGAREPVLLALLAAARAYSGDSTGARALVGELERMRRQRYVPPEPLALVHLSLGDRAAALRELNEARRRRSAGIVYLDIEPLLDPLHTEPEFRRLVRETHGRDPGR